MRARFLFVRAPRVSREWETAASRSSRGSTHRTRCQAANLYILDGRNHRLRRFFPLDTLCTSSNP